MCIRRKRKKKKREKDDAIVKGEAKREKKEAEERKGNERTVLSLANAFPSTSTLLREEHEKSNVSIYRSLSSLSLLSPSAR